MIIVGGFNVYPAEVESTLAGHPSVGQAAVVGTPDGRMGEVPVAFVVPVAGTDPVGEQDLIDWARARMANFKVPRRVRYVDALPLNASGKVQKYELRARAGDEKPA
jgi:acyl-CoA synthetase (AMP-forming)/AMP-acid ligase II